MSGPRTARDALLAELLGDMDQLLNRFERSQNEMERLRAAIEQGHDTKTSQATRELEAATIKFGEVTTRNVDDFVNVANEALSKFMQRTNEIKAALDLLQDGIRNVNTPSAPAPAVASSPVAKIPLWPLPVLFAAGLVVGIGVSFAF